MSIFRPIIIHNVFQNNIILPFNFFWRQSLQSSSAGQRADNFSLFVNTFFSRSASSLFNLIFTSLCVSHNQRANCFQLEIALDLSSVSLVQRSKLIKKRKDNYI